MEIPYEESMTESMKEVFAHFINQMEEEYLYCDAQFNKAEEAMVKLPHVNEQGVPVIHGCNVVMHRIGLYWLIRRDATKDFLSKEFIKQHDVNMFIQTK